MLGEQGLLPGPRLPRRAERAVLQPDTDWTGDYIPGLQISSSTPPPATHHYWEAAGGDESLEPNLTKWPTNQLPVRQADQPGGQPNAPRVGGEAGLENPELELHRAHAADVLRLGGPVANMTFSATANAAAAKQVLEKAGGHAGQ